SVNPERICSASGIVSETGAQQCILCTDFGFYIQCFQALNPEGICSASGVVSETVIIAQLNLLIVICDINIYIQDYVKLLEEILSSGDTSAGDKLAIIAERLSHNFDSFIGSSSAQQFWNNLRIKEKKTSTNTKEIVLQEKEKQNTYQIRSNMIEKNIQSLAKKRKNMDSSEKKQQTKQTSKQNIDKPLLNDKSETDLNDKQDFDKNEVHSVNPNT
ncbi:1754_t:CDS:2, partial [Racocetra persica]